MQLCILCSYEKLIVLENPLNECRLIDFLQFSISRMHSWPESCRKRRSYYIVLLEMGYAEPVLMEINKFTCLVPHNATKHLVFFHLLRPLSFMSLNLGNLAHCFPALITNGLALQKDISRRLHTTKSQFAYFNNRTIQRRIHRKGILISFKIS